VGKLSVREGRGDGVLLLVRPDNLKAAHRWLAMVSEAVVMSGHRNKGAGPHGAVMISGRGKRNG
jgi:hypothetical protein